MKWKVEGERRVLSSGTVGGWTGSMRLPQVLPTARTIGTG